jgi:hypothetical protein
MPLIHGALPTLLVRCRVPSAAIVQRRTAPGHCPPPHLCMCARLLSIRLFLLLPLLPVFVPEALTTKETGKLLLQPHIVARPSCIPPFFLAWPRRCAPASYSQTSSRMGSHTRMLSTAVRLSTRSPTSSKLRTATLRYSSAAHSMRKSTSTRSPMTIGYVIPPQMCTSSVPASEAPSTPVSSHHPP